MEIMVEMIADCRVDIFFLKTRARDSHKTRTICDLQTQKHCKKSLDVFDQRSKYSNKPFWKSGCLSSLTRAHKTAPNKAYN